MEIKRLDDVGSFDLDEKCSKARFSSEPKAQRIHIQNIEEDDELYDLDLRIKEAVNALPINETGHNWYRTEGCSRACRTQGEYTCRCGHTLSLCCNP